MIRYRHRFILPGQPRMVLFWAEPGARLPLPPHAANDE